MLASICLHIFHCLYSLAIAFIHTWNHLYSRKPRPLTTARSKIPSHLALLLVADDAVEVETIEASIVENIAKTVAWCQVVGIKELTVYDAKGFALASHQQIRTRLISDQPPCEDDTDSEVEYPLTPPLSEKSESRPMSPVLQAQLGLVTIQVSELRVPKPRKSRHNVLKRRHAHKSPTTPLTLNLVSREASKPTLVSITRSYAQAALTCNTKASLSQPLFEISASALEAVLEGRNGLAPPSLMIVHHLSPPPSFYAPLELHGFPLWQLKLTEIYSSQSASYWFKLSKPTPILERDFRAALDEYAGAEMRLGK